jgi:hypothetical protein
MSHNLKWRRARKAKAKKPTHHTTFYPRDALGKRALSAWRDWRATLTPSQQRSLYRPSRR